MACKKLTQIPHNQVARYPDLPFPFLWLHLISSELKLEGKYQQSALKALRKLQLRQLTDTIYQLRCTLSYSRAVTCVSWNCCISCLLSTERNPESLYAIPFGLNNWKNIFTDDRKAWQNQEKLNLSYCALSVYFQSYEMGVFYSSIWKKTGLSTLHISVSSCYPDP